MAEVAAALPEEKVNDFLGLPPEKLAFHLKAQKAKIKHLNDNLSVEKAEQTLIENALLAYAAEHPGTSKLSYTGIGTVTFGEETVYNVGKNEWDDFYSYVKDNNAFHLLQRRLMNNSIREILAQGIELPFVTPFTKQKIGLRK